MCGIIAVLRRPSSREVPDLMKFNDLLDSIANSLSLEDLIVLKKQVESLDFVNSQLKGLPGFFDILQKEDLVAEIEKKLILISVFF